MEACIEDFTDHVDDAKTASNQRRVDILIEIGEHVFNAYDAIEELGEASEAALSNSNQARKDSLKAY